jgi:hypothetical protein
MLEMFRNYLFIIYPANLAETKLLKLVDSSRCVSVNTKSTDKGKWACYLLKLHRALA